VLMSLGEAPIFRRLASMPIDRAPLFVGHASLLFPSGSVRSIFVVDGPITPLIEVHERPGPHLLHHDVYDFRDPSKERPRERPSVWLPSRSYASCPPRNRRHRESGSPPAMTAASRGTPSG
jgi:hypothetical protein